MKKITTLCLSLAAASALTVNASDAVKVAKQFKHTPTWGISVPGMHGLQANKIAAQAGGLSMGTTFAPRMVSDTPAASNTGAYFGFLTGPDGTQWYYTESISWTADGYYYTGADITVYDSKHKQQGQVKVTIPDGMRVNSIEPYGQITKKMFDRNDRTYELMVSIHAAGSADNGYQAQYYTRAYSLANGELVQELNGAGILFDASEGWNTYQRVIVPRFETVGETDSIYIDVYAPGGYNDKGPKLEHTFKLAGENTYYSDGSYLNNFVVNGKPYYVLSYYEKPYVDSYTDDGDIVPAENNHYILEVYDKNYTRVDSISIPLEKASDAFCRMAMFGMMSDEDMSEGYYTPSGERAYVVTLYDYVTSSDSYRYNFYVFDSKGEQKKTICENAVENVWYTLNPIKGESDQMVFLQAIGSGQQYQTVNIPSCEPQAVIPAIINGENIGSPINRAPAGDSYQYVINMRNADTDDDGNVIARIGWYNPDLSFDHFTKFNLGPDAEYFTPLLSSTVLNPYLFDTDDDMEFIYGAKKRHTQADGKFTIDKSVEIAKSDGTVIRSYESNGKRSVAQQGVLEMSTGKYELLIATLDSTQGKYVLDFYNLPFNKFSKGGNGEPTNPYQIATVGDLQQIAQDPKASYVMANDIDMSLYNGLWNPIDEFSGSLNGANHTIYNLAIDGSSSHVGLFGRLAEKAKVNNLVFVKPEVTASKDNQYIGILAGEAVQDSIRNIHVFDASISGADNVDAITGGIVGEAALYNVIDGSSFQGTISLPGSTSVGGVAGQTSTSSSVAASAAKADITGAEAVGGIVGTTNTDCKVTDCKAEGSLTAGNTVGGIVGSSSRGLVSKSVFSGKLAASKVGWNGLSVGGIVGALASDWTSTPATAISNCVADASIEAKPAETDKTVNGIVGKTIANESYEPGETPRTEKGLANNYSTGSAATDATDVNGAAVKADDLNKDFFTTLGYAYGNTVTQPWKDAKTLPQLYFQNVAKALMLEADEMDMPVGTKANVLATVYGIDGFDINAQSDNSSVADVEITSADDNTATLTITAHKTGQARIIVTAGDLTYTCLVNVTEASAISKVSTEGNSLTIRLTADAITASGASTISVYTLGGQLLEKIHTDTIGMGSFGKGTYVVTATDAQGNQRSTKIAIK